MTPHTITSYLAARETLRGATSTGYFFELAPAHREYVYAEVTVALERGLCLDMIPAWESLRAKVRGSLTIATMPDGRSTMTITVRGPIEAYGIRVVDEQAGFELEGSAP